MKKSTIGLAPGTLVYEGEDTKTHIRIVSYHSEGKEEQVVKNLDELPKLLRSKGIHWVQVRGLGEVEKIKALGDMFSISPLVLEDILNENQRPKIEAGEEYDFLTLKRYFSEKGKVISRQVSLIMTKQIVLSFQHTDESIFHALEGRFEQRRYGRLNQHGASYLAYAIVDFLIDQYFFVQEYFEEKIEALSEDIHKHRHAEDVKDRLYSLRTQLLSFQKSVLPLSEVADRLLKNPRYIEGNKNIVPYLQDLRDHILHMQDFVRTYGETLESLSSFYFSITADKTNQVMQMLTVITIIFLPLTLLAGIYGMNFHYMPELEIKWAYPILLVVMLLIAIGIYMVFKRKKWL